MSNNLPDKPSKKGHQGRVRHPDGKVWPFTITDEICHTQHNLPEKFFCLQRLDFGGKQEFRLGYYIIGKKPRAKGRWVWGQYCPLLPKRDFEAIIRKAVRRGWVKL